MNSILNITVIVQVRWSIAVQSDVREMDRGRTIDCMESCITLFFIKGVCMILQSSENSVCFNCDNIRRKKRSSLTAGKKFKILAKSRKINRAKRARLHPFKQNCISGGIQGTRCILHTRTYDTLMQNKQLSEYEIVKTPKNT